LETLNRVFSISQKWDLPGYSTKRFSCNIGFRAKSIVVVVVVVDYDEYHTVDDHRLQLGCVVRTCRGVGLWHCDVANVYPLVVNLLYNKL